MPIAECQAYGDRVHSLGKGKTIETGPQPPRLRGRIFTAAEGAFAPPLLRQTDPTTRSRRDTRQAKPPRGTTTLVTHQQLVRMAEHWLRRSYRCGIVLSEQSCASGETPDVIAWKGRCRSVLVECKISHADFLADREKPFRKCPELGMGCERFYLAPAMLIGKKELPEKWGLLEVKGREVHVAVRPSRVSQRTETGFMWEMNLLLASLRRVEVRIEPQTITDFLKWKNRLLEYNGGRLPQGIDPLEPNLYLAGTGPVVGQ
jgi:hypothetical protein